MSLRQGKYIDIFLNKCKNIENYLNKMSIIVERIAEVIEFQSISVRAFEQRIGASNGMIGRAISKNTDISASWLSKIIETFPNVNPTWLLSGVGEKFISENERPKQASNLNAQQSCLNAHYEHPIPETKIIPRDGVAFDKRIEHQSVPLYDFDAVAGLVPVFSGKNTPIDYISIPNMPKVDGAVPICGDSMYPLLKSGDIVMYKIVNDLSNIIWGEMYLVSMAYDDDEYIAVKYLNRVEADPSRVLLVSYNTHHAPKEVPIQSIRALGLIKATIRFNTMG